MELRLVGLLWGEREDELPEDERERERLLLERESQRKMNTNINCTCIHVHKFNLTTASLIHTAKTT